MVGNKKFLLVLDDVSDVSQLENLAPKQGWFSKGSIILITTRDKHLLSSHGVSSVYDIKFLNDNESLKLFLHKAFKGEQPNEDYLDLARTVIKYAGGLPLALKVLGSFLCKRTIMEWKDALAKFKKAPPKDILKILQVSFDGLDIKEKTIFLDIACFFNGMAQDHVIQILETLDEDLHPRIGITILIEKSLVIDYEGYLWVHEILQDMGKFIVYQKSPDDVGKRSRILSLEDANHVLERNKGTEAIRGILLRLEKSCDVFWDPKAFLKMSNLKILIISISSYSDVSHCQLNLPYGLKTLSSELKIIEWERYPLLYLPSQPQLHKLVELKMQHSKLKELWREIQPLQSLKSIDLSHSECLIKTPNFDGIPHLEKLILEGCFNLVEIDQSLGQHKKLVIVNLKGCRKVKILPRKVEMNKLEAVVLSGCTRIRKLPQFGKDMKCLSKLDVQETSITKLPQSLGNLIGLTELNLENCKKLVCLPYNICKLKALKIIRIPGCSKLSKLPENLNENEALEELDLSKIAVKGLSLYKYNAEAQSLSSWSCFSLLCRRPLSSTNFILSPPLSFLRKLNLVNCNLHDGSLLDDISKLSSLEVLDLSETISLTYHLPDFQSFQASRS
ncbi:TMV resistance protein N-like [Neltuma alba]|uniref:TMV resistance protein N-like n=1 Tax=Neltuma alba TaxID=207710 RepID=UPI0010A2FD78|nr:TMV resistance protein N-like [Prosopis alba]